MNTSALNPHGRERGKRRLVILALVGVGLAWTAWPGVTPAQPSDPVADAAQKLLARDNPEAEQPAAANSAAPKTSAADSGANESAAPEQPRIGKTPYGLWVESSTWM